MVAAGRHSALSRWCLVVWAGLASAVVAGGGGGGFMRGRYGGRILVSHQGHGGAQSGDGNSRSGFQRRSSLGSSGTQVRSNGRYTRYHLDSERGGRNKWKRGTPAAMAATTATYAEMEEAMRMNLMTGHVSARPTSRARGRRKSVNPRHLSSTALSATASTVEIAAAMASTVFVHELGHFAAAYFQGIRVEEFSIGIGPRLASFNISLPVVSIGNNERPQSSSSLNQIANQMAKNQTFDSLNNFSAEKAGVLQKQRDGRHEGGRKAQFSLRLLPLGGYVRMPPPGKYSGDPDLASNRPWLQQAAVIMAGIAANIASAWIAILVGLTVAGVPTPSLLPGVAVKAVQQESLASSAGIVPGDIITSVNGEDVKSSVSFVANALLQGRSDELDGEVGTVRIEVLRDGEIKSIELRLAGSKHKALETTTSFTTTTTTTTPTTTTTTTTSSTSTKSDNSMGDGISSISPDISSSSSSVSSSSGSSGSSRSSDSSSSGGSDYANSEPPIGLILQPRLEGIYPKRPASAADAVAATNKEFSRLVQFMGGQIEAAVARPSEAKLAGPISIAQIGNSYVNEGGLYGLMLFTAILNINLAALNALPIPGLDGGQLAFLLVETASGRRLNRRFTTGVNVVAQLALVFLTLSVLGSEAKKALLALLASSRH